MLGLVVVRNILLWSLFCFVSGTENCPSSEWHFHDNSCWLIKRSDSQTWFEARRKCSMFGGDLAIIPNNGTQSYLKGLIGADSSLSLWIGLSDPCIQYSFSWVNEDPLFYSNWGQFQPSYTGGCVSMYGSGSLWKEESCDVSSQYICQAHAGPSPPSTTLTPKELHCPDGWSKGTDSCYLSGGFSDSTKLSWTAARTECQSMGGDLVTIHSAVEQAYVTRYLNSSGIYGAWIGLSMTAEENDFCWCDGSQLDYVNWEMDSPKEPLKKEMCVSLITSPAQSGEWNDEDCSVAQGYMCEMPPDPYYPPECPVRTLCSGGGPELLEFDGSCYLLSSVPVDYQSASDSCGSDHDLVFISNGFEAAFVQTILLNNGWSDIWIGLDDRDENGVYSWSNGWPVEYTKWGYNEPKRVVGEGCVAATATSGWIDSNCSDYKPSICKFTPDEQPTPASPLDGYCPPYWKEHGDFCYSTVPAQFGLYDWSEGQLTCHNAAVGSALASIHSKDENDFLLSWVRNISTSIGFWVGLHRNNLGGFVWSDLTPVGFTHWSLNEPHANEMNCVTFGGEFGMWKVTNCSVSVGVICKAPKRSYEVSTTAHPSPVPSVSTLDPGLSPPLSTFQNPTSCPSDSWVVFNEFCWQVISGNQSSWYDARRHCLQYGGDLAVIISDETQVFINSLLGDQLNVSVWIGLSDPCAVGVYTWVDNDPLKYSFWANDQPLWSGGCVSVHGKKSSWMDESCDQMNGFVCQVTVAHSQFTTMSPIPLSTTPSTTVEVTGVTTLHMPTKTKTTPSTNPLLTTSPSSTPTPPELHCPDGWVKGMYSCYTTGGFSDSSKLNWTAARAECQRLGGDLVTIHSSADQAYVTTQIQKSSHTGVWIGLHYFKGDRGFDWVDGSWPHYKNWAQGEPDGSPEIDMCVEMINSPVQSGEWDDTDCSHGSAYICEKPADPFYPPECPGMSLCGSADYIEFYDSCFLPLSSPLSFDDAVDACGVDHTLASIADGYEAAFVETILLDKGWRDAWIGLKDANVDGKYSWIDEWPVQYTKWGYSEPSRGPDEGCVAATASSGWMDTNCSDPKPVLCKFSFDVKPSIPPPFTGSCPPSWRKFEGHCYYASPATKKYFKWTEAETDCQMTADDAELVSIHSQEENDFLLSLVKGIPTSNAFWIGLYRNPLGGFSWSDLSPVDFTLWADSEPAEKQRNCISFDGTSGMWMVDNCTTIQGLICKTVTTPETTSSSSRMSTAVNSESSTPSSSIATAASSTTHPDVNATSLSTLAALSQTPSSIPLSSLPPVSLTVSSQSQSTLPPISQTLSSLPHSSLPLVSKTISYQPQSTLPPISQTLSSLAQSSVAPVSHTISYQSQSTLPSISQTLSSLSHSSLSPVSKTISYQPQSTLTTMTPSETMLTSTRHPIRPTTFPPETKMSTTSAIGLFSTLSNTYPPTSKLSSMVSSLNSFPITTAPPSSRSRKPHLSDVPTGTTEASSSTSEEGSTHETTKVTTPAHSTTSDAGVPGDNQGMGAATITGVILCSLIVLVLLFAVGIVILKKTVLRKDNELAYINNTVNNGYQNAVFDESFDDEKAYIVNFPGNI